MGSRVEMGVALGGSGGGAVGCRHEAWERASHRVHTSESGNRWGRPCRSSSSPVGTEIKTLCALRPRAHPQVGNTHPQVETTHDAKHGR
jgi:hypothetical protein